MKQMVTELNLSIYKHPDVLQFSPTLSNDIFNDTINVDFVPLFYQTYIQLIGLLLIIMVVY